MMYYMATNNITATTKKVKRGLHWISNNFLNITSPNRLINGAQHPVLLELSDLVVYLVSQVGSREGRSEIGPRGIAGEGLFGGETRKERLISEEGVSRSTAWVAS